MDGGDENIQIRGRQLAGKDQFASGKELVIPGRPEGAGPETMNTCFRGLCA
jgi:hypothetical protein